ncbi:CLUMA_CG006434, isoform A [Clunio marinus]|uniref:CLUMA_CG006434, isoform A n=1 Tax=Clunio marinus TaxID=568069 RepID=A0A1J1HZ47_9DIPT|nr:CLUMA_CG006434, isoform A [Clunio marinus]
MILLEYVALPERSRYGLLVWMWSIEIMTALICNRSEILQPAYPITEEFPDRHSIPHNQQKKVEKRIYVSIMNLVPY